MRKLFFICSLFTSVTQAQSDLEVLGYNLFFGTLTSGLGATINKTPEQKWNEAFLEGSWKGALGGSMLYGSKKLIAQVHSNEDWYMAWSSKLIHDTGASFIENGAANKPLLDQINLNIGFVRNEFRFDNGVSYHPRIKPFALLLTAYSASGNQLDWNRSLVYGTPIFISNDENLPNALGITHANSIVLRKSFSNNFGLINHEMIHVFQVNEYSGLNSFILPHRSRWKKNDTYRKITNIFYIEYHMFVYYSFYFADELIQGRPFNFLEQEAYNFSSVLR